MKELLPIGTLVQVTPFPTSEKRPYQAIVRGYDMGRTKYHLGDEYMRGLFMEKGLSWAFPGQVKEISNGTDRYPDCTCWAPDDAEPEDHDTDCPEHPTGEDGCE